MAQGAKVLMNGTYDSFFPSIWVRDFTNKKDFDTSRSEQSSYFNVIGKIDDRMLESRHPFLLKAWCVACQAATEMRVDWHYCGASPDGAVHPAWTETCACSVCGLNSRMRALLDCLINKIKAKRESNIYLPEQITPSFKAIKKLFKHVTGSEYLGTQRQSGETAMLVKETFQGPARGFLQFVLS